MHCAKLVLKCADLSHVFSGLDNHLRWVSFLEEEFFCQGDREKELGLHLTASFDRTGLGISRTQKVFFDLIVLGLFDKLFTAFPATLPIKVNIELNHDHWRSKSKSTSSRKSTEVSHS